MLKILSASQVRELDRFTIDHEPVSPIDLMERACQSFVDWFVPHFRTEKKIGVVCGPGNNGGDGLGIARMLKELGYSVKVWIVRDTVKETESFKANLERLPDKIGVYAISTASDRGLFTDCDILLDALFGSGLSRPPEGIFAQVGIFVS